MNLQEPFASAIEGLAVQLAAATSDAAAAVQVLEAAEEAQNTVAGRVTALSAQREEIVRRRGAGRHEENDGASLALIQADLEGLHPILAEAAASVAAARAAFDAASTNAQRIRGQIEQAEAEAACQALARHADVLSEKLMETMRLMGVNAVRAGRSIGRPAWGAPKELYLALRTIAAARNEL